MSFHSNVRPALHPLRLLLLAAACSACAPGEAEVALGRSRQAVTGGAPTSSFPAVVALVDERGQTFCSGVAVSATEILSAAHCVLPPAPVLAWLSPGHEDGDEPTQRFEAARVWAHPGFDPETLAHDLARIVTAAPLELESAQLRAARLTDHDEGRSVQVVGFGRVGLLGGGGQKNAGPARIESVDEAALWLAPAPATPCNGDSGGGVFATDSTPPELVGVISRGDLFCGAYAVATPVDQSSLLALRPARDVANCALSQGASPSSAARALALVALLLLTARRRATWSLCRLHRDCQHCCRPVVVDRRLLPRRHERETSCPPPTMSW